MIQDLSPELKDLVGHALELLGRAISLELGPTGFKHVEEIRQSYKGTRNADVQAALALDHEVIARLTRMKPALRHKTAHAFAVSLEVINACENAYRSFRLRQKTPMPLAPFDSKIVYVLTAHPTESRSPECIALFTELTSKLMKVLAGQTGLWESEIFHLMILALKVPVARNLKPEVSDEANYIYSIALRPEMLHSLIDSHAQGRSVFLRTWVGGDKDGHPGVNAKVMRQSLSLARTRLVSFALVLLDELDRDLALIDQATVGRLKNSSQTLRRQLRSLSKVSDGDGARVTGFRKKLDALELQYRGLLQVPSPALTRLQDHLVLFPGLVVPMELRESATLIREARQSGKGAIADMLRSMGRLSRGGNILWYARSFIVSSTESASDILEAVKLTKLCMSSQNLPIAPLFESRASLSGSRKILEELFATRGFLDLCRRSWNSRFEIMVGYSDSAKENGSLLSRTLIRDSLFDLERLLESQGLVPVFFHGSGGSVARGGGSLEEQVAWWPASSRKTFKVTLQGEMIYRSFSREEIFEAQTRKIFVNSTSSAVPYDETRKARAPLDAFSLKVAACYQKLVFDPEFLEIIKRSTPYQYLSELRIGSRPTKRSKGFQLSTLRAIPWVLCWTQIRSLLPIWWGLGMTWKEAGPTERAALQKLIREDAFFSSFVKLLAFSLAKVDLSVWFSYLDHSTLSPALIEKYKSLFGGEFTACLGFVRELSGEEQLLWFRPWLATSIQLRSTMIHPLNMAQIVALKKKEAALLRETVTGIASGMMTTG